MFLEEEIYGIEYRNLDSKNRISIPLKLKAEPGDKVTILKVGNHAEIWNTKDIRKELEEIKKKLKNQIILK